MHRVTEALLLAMYAARRQAAKVRDVALYAHISALNARVNRAFAKKEAAFRAQAAWEQTVEREQQRAQNIYDAARENAARHGVQFD